MSAYVAVRAGALDHTIQIERKSPDTIDEFGAPTETWIALGTFRAELTEGGVEETIAESGAVTRTAEVLTFKLRWLSGLSVTDRVFYAGRAFDIIEASEIQRRRGWIIKCRHKGL
jgi:head-tail adaptor